MPTIKNYKTIKKLFWVTDDEINFIINFCKDDPFKIFIYRTAIKYRTNWDNIKKDKIKLFIEKQIKLLGVK